MLLALATLFSPFFWLTIVMLAVINPPDPFAGNLTFIRMLVAMVAGAWLTWLAWTIADNRIDA